MYISDCFLPAELISTGGVSQTWLKRPGFGIRKAVILKWIFLGNILTKAYESTLLSSLVTIRYEDTIDSINDLDKSGLPLLMMEASSAFEFFSTDSRPIMGRIFNRSIFFSASDGVPQWTYDM